jgi:hypothetical protein
VQEEDDESVVASDEDDEEESSDEEEEEGMDWDQLEEQAARSGPRSAWGSTGCDKPCLPF